METTLVQKCEHIYGDTHDRDVNPATQKNLIVYE